LTGIPQVLIESPRHVNQVLDADQRAVAGTRDALLNTFSNTNSTNDYADDGDVVLDKNEISALWGSAYLDFDALIDPYPVSDERHFISAANRKKLSGKKEIFSPDTFSCCIGTGVQVEADVTASQCCTGLVTDQAGPRRCCLEDYVDLSVYTNL